MKTLRLICLFVLAISLGSCNDTNIDDTKTNSESDLIGTWKMVKAYGGISGNVYNVPEGNVTWAFNTDANTLNIVNNNTDPGFDGGLSTGSYNYEIMQSDVPQSCRYTLSIDGNDYGCFTRTDAGLTITQVYADGLIYEFVK
ncbi:MAG: hypothetical protein CFE23_14195 [Flavobacterium sp. BFFFF1]|uniref:hypothetical protein n=1 Tax=unclassified Flavobacterium TaxID=196869 RepID=UPI000BD144D6|nr:MULTISPECIES: hypothetical protein [unclassified Flavobacterium]OYU79384.1 MAG: hypothetical protein CFE23_14195 [Flavobacterium sp. BFFFF1]